MKTTLSTTEAAEILIADTYARWSRSGAFALVEYLEDLEESTGEEIEFDRVAIRCDFSEYSSLKEWAEDYFWNPWKDLGFDETQEIQDEGFDEKAREYIQDHGTLIEFDGGIIVSSF